MSGKTFDVGDSVRIVGNHPHAGSRGKVKSLEPPKIAAQVPSLRSMIEVKLDEGGGCFAQPALLRKEPT